MKRREFITFVGGVGVWPFASYAAMAQPSDRVRQIAMLSGFSATDPEAQARIAVLQEGLKELGWIEGRNLSIEFRWGTGGAEQMRASARQLEPISKSPEEDNEAGELNKAQEVLGVVLPANEDPALPLKPGEEALDEPASHVAA